MNANSSFPATRSATSAAHRLPQPNGESIPTTGTKRPASEAFLQAASLPELKKFGINAPNTNLSSTLLPAPTPTNAPKQTPTVVLSLKGQPSDIYQYVASIPNENHFDLLYSDPVVASAIFRSLTDTERLFTIRLLHLPDPIRWNPFVLWFGGETTKTLEILNSLRRKRIVVMFPGATTTSAASVSGITPVDSLKLQSAVGHQASRSGSPASSDTGSVASSIFDSGTASKSGKQTATQSVRYQLHSKFGKTLAECLKPKHIRYTNGVLRVPSSRAKHIPTAQILHKHATDSWANLLHWMVGDVVYVKCGSTERQGGNDASSANFNPLTASATGGGRSTIWRPITLNKNKTPITVPSPDVQNIFKGLRLVEPNHDIAPSHEMTSQAFQWLLKNRKAQLNSLCVAYIKILSTVVTSTEEGQRQGYDDCAYLDVLIFLISLSQSKIGQACSVGNLTPIQKRALTFAFDLGFIWFHKPQNPKHYFTTPSVLLLLQDSEETNQLASCLSIDIDVGGPKDSGFLSPWQLPLDLYSPPMLAQSMTKQKATQKSDMGNADMGLIVESNFKVFAYTASALQISIVSQLCELRMLSPCISVGLLTRSSVMNTYKGGTTAEDIIRFLTTHAHPMLQTRHVLEGKPILPDDIATQLRLWEGERCRIKLFKACVYEFAKEDLHLFPQAVARAGVGWTITHSPLPSNPNTESTAFQEWRTVIEERLMKSLRTASSPSMMTAGEETVLPVLAIHAMYKNDMTAYIRQVTSSKTITPSASTGLLRAGHF